MPGRWKRTRRSAPWAGATSAADRSGSRTCIPVENGTAERGVWQDQAVRVGLRPGRERRRQSDTRDNRLPESCALPARILGERALGQVNLLERKRGEIGLRRDGLALGRRI